VVFIFSFANWGSLALIASLISHMFLNFPWKPDLYHKHGIFRTCNWFRGMININLSCVLLTAFAPGMAKWEKQVFLYASFPLWPFFYRLQGLLYLTYDALWFLRCAANLQAFKSRSYSGLYPGDLKSVPSIANMSWQHAIHSYFSDVAINVSPLLGLDFNIHLKFEFFEGFSKNSSYLPNKKKFFSDNMRSEGSFVFPGSKFLPIDKFSEILEMIRYYEFSFVFFPLVTDFLIIIDPKFHIFNFGNKIGLA